MTTYTHAQVATRVLRDLGLLGAEETPSDADLDWATETLESELMMMAAKGINLWNNRSGAVPQEYLTTLSRRIGLALAPSFGLTDIASAQVAMRAAEDDLRILGGVPGTGAHMTAEYF